VLVTGGRNLVRSGAANDYVTVAYRSCPAAALAQLASRMRSRFGS